MLFFLSIGLILALAAAYVTQPLLWPTSPRGDATRRVDPRRLRAHVDAMVNDFFPRDEGHPENLRRAADVIASTFAEAGGVVSYQEFEVGSRSYVNVIAGWGPASAERIVVGAHYDTAGELPGADDNASGVAGVMELARLFSGWKPAMRIELVAYALEEPPHFKTPNMGSARHVARLRREGVRIRLMVGLEMIGYFDDRAKSQEYPSPILKLFYPSSGNFVAIVGRIGEGGLVRRFKRAMRAGTSLPVYSINAPRFVPGIDFSDHLNFWNAGYPALMVTDTAFYRNVGYHSPLDRPETLNYERMAMVVEGVFAAVREFAQ